MPEYLLIFGLAERSKGVGLFVPYNFSDYDYTFDSFPIKTAESGKLPMVEMKNFIGWRAKTLLYCY